MLRYILRRVGFALGMILLVSALVFFVIRALPGDPATARLGGLLFIDQSQIDAVRHEMGLDQPVIVQYLTWMSGIFTGDFGNSYANGIPVSTLMGQRIGPSFELALGGILIAVMLAAGFAYFAVALRSRAPKAIVEGYTIFGLSAPPFVIGMVLILLFAVAAKALPVGGYVSPEKDLGRHLVALVLPCLTLGIAVSAPLIRYLIASMSEVESALFVRTARGKGLPWSSVVSRHVFPNGLLPALTSLGISVGVLLGGVVEIEYVFSWPGLGSQMVTAVQQRDYALIQTTVLLAASLVILSNLVVDLLYGVLDPRLRVRRARVQQEAEA